MHHLFKRVRAHYARLERRARLADPEPHVGLLRARPRRRAERRGRAARDQRLRPRRPASRCRASRELADDGSTACGCWIYSGVYADGVNQARRREPGDCPSPAAGWRRSGAGPGPPTAACSTSRVAPTRRAAVVRAQALRLVGRGEESGRATTCRTSRSTSRPDYVAPDDAEGMDAISGTDPFIMQADGRGWLFSPAGLLDGPLPTHYEPLESPVKNALYPEIDENPAALRWDRAGQPASPTPATRAARSWPRPSALTEQHTAGGMSRWVPWLAELQPEMFAEIDPVLARERGIEDGGWMTISSPRGGDRGARQGDRPDQAAAARRPRRPPGRPALALGLRRPVAGRLGERHRRALGRPQRVDPGVEGVRLQRPRGRARRAATGKLAGVRDKPPGVAVNRDHPAEIRPHR